MLIHELSIHLSATQIRILYFFCYQKLIVLTHLALLKFG